MKSSTVLALLCVCSPLLAFTGCTGDDQPNTDAQNAGNNPTNQVRVCTLPVAPPTGMTLTPGDNSGPIHIVFDAGDGYTLLLQPTADPENGIFIWNPSGDVETFVLTPNTGEASRNLNLIFRTSMEGTYTSDSLGQGSFILDGLSGGCGAY